MHYISAVQYGGHWPQWGYQVPELWLVQTEMCFSVEYTFEDSMKKRKPLNILYWYVEITVF